MTRQEAINYLHLLEANVLLGQKITEAVHMAIEALEKQHECKKCEYLILGKKWGDEYG